MTVYKIGVLEGDGIGEEIIHSAVSILQKAEALLGITTFELVPLPMGMSAIEQYNSTMPDETIKQLKNVHGWIMGPHDSVAYPDNFKRKRNPSGELRHTLDLFANIRPVKSIPGVNGLVNNIDLVIYRENTEGFYADRNMLSGNAEWKVNKDVVISAGVFTRPAVSRIIKTAFESARSRKKKLTLVHKANVLRLGTGMFKEIFYEMAKDYPDIEVNDYHIDAMAALLVRQPEYFDVIVTENMFGDILSDLAAELNGSLGLASSINTNGTQAMAQAVHGAAPDIAGKGIANPTGIILSMVMLLEWLGNKHKDKNLLALSHYIEKGVFNTLEKGILTPDLGGSCSTKEFTNEIINSIDLNV